MTQEPIFTSYNWKGMKVREYPATSESATFLTVDFPSSRDPEVRYTVLIEGSAVECTCPDFTYRGHDAQGRRIPGYTCKHIRAIAEKVRERQ